MNEKANQKCKTMTALLNALKEELISSQRLTVEAIAERAGVNKALVYRYFGGLDGLVIAFAKSEDFMPSAATVFKECGKDWQTQSPRERFVHCIQAYIRLLAERPATLQIFQRVATFSDEILKALDAGREREIAQVRAAMTPPAPTVHFDGDMAFYLLLAGACSLLGSKHSKWRDSALSREEIVLRINNTISTLLLSQNSKEKSAKEADSGQGAS
jgi:Transcriptional regulator